MQNGILYLSTELMNEIEELKIKNKASKKKKKVHHNGCIVGTLYLLTITLISSCNLHSGGGILRYLIGFSRS